MWLTLLRSLSSGTSSSETWCESIRQVLEFPMSFLWGTRRMLRHLIWSGYFSQRPSPMNSSDRRRQMESKWVIRLGYTLSFCGRDFEECRHLESISVVPQILPKRVARNTLQCFRTGKLGREKKNISLFNPKVVPRK